MKLLHQPAFSTPYSKVLEYEWPSHIGPIGHFALQCFVRLDNWDRLDQVRTSAHRHLIGTQKPIFQVPGFEESFETICGLALQFAVLWEYHDCRCFK